MSKEALDYPKRGLFVIPPEDIKIVGLDTNDGPEHELWDERIHLPVKETLVLSILADGVLEPVTVRKDGERLEAVNGRQRIRAAREANKRLVARGEPPIAIAAQYKKVSALGAASAMVTTNEHRTDDDVLTRAAKAARLYDRGMSPDEIGLRFAKTGATVRIWLRVATLHPQLQEAIRNNACTVAEAAAYADKGQDAQRKAGIAFLDAQEGTVQKEPKPKAEGAAKLRRKGRSAKVVARALVGAPPPREAALRWWLDPEATIDSLLPTTEDAEQRARELEEIVKGLAFIVGAEINEES